ncbi:MAG: polyphenol oxidase family protein [Acidimicrobiia bacterium]|nr:polyphenol oxidase family protein [Acidimicrobiia bacterium]
MIRPPGFRGAAFSEASDGDLRAGDRSGVARRLGISPEWATVRQVHGRSVVLAGAPGELSAADALVTEEVGLPVAVFTADCMGIVIEADRALAVVHAGWRGVVAGAIDEAVDYLVERGHTPIRAAIGPAIGPCCYEVGPEVASEFASGSKTTWGTTSVDLPTAAALRLKDIEIWVDGRCTRCEPGFFSHRRDGDVRRLAAIGWL